MSMYGINQVGYGYYNQYQPRFTGTDPYLQQMMNSSVTNPTANQPIISATNPISQDTVQISTKPQVVENKKGLSKGAKIGLGALATAAIAGAIYIATRGRVNTTKLAEHIEFKPAKTIEEARLFAKEHLGIKTYELENLDVANYVNEGLTNLSNTYKGKEMFTAIRKNADDFVGLMSYSEHGRCLSVKEKGVLNLVEPENLEKEFNVFWKECSTNDSYNLSENTKKLIDKFRKDPQSLTLNEKMNLRYICADFHEGKSYTLAYFADLIENKQVVNYLKTNNYITTVEDFVKLKVDEQNNLLEKIFDNVECKINVHDRGAFVPINHEFGHRMHEKNVGWKRFNEMTPGVKHSANVISEQQTEHLKKFAQQEPYWSILDRVSKYSLFSEGEAIAEIFAGAQNGVKYNNEVMKLYEKYGGPKLM